MVAQFSRNNTPKYCILIIVHNLHKIPLVDLAKFFSAGQLQKFFWIRESRGV